MARDMTFGTKQHLNALRERSSMLSKIFLFVHFFRKKKRVKCRPRCSNPNCFVFLSSRENNPSRFLRIRATLTSILYHIERPMGSKNHDRPFTRGILCFLSSQIAMGLGHTGWLHLSLVCCTSHRLDSRLFDVRDAGSASVARWIARDSGLSSNDAKKLGGSTRSTKRYLYTLTVYTERYVYARARASMCPCSCKNAPAQQVMNQWELPTEAVQEITRRKIWLTQNANWR